MKTTQLKTMLNRKPSTYVVIKALNNANGIRGIFGQVLGTVTALTAAEAMNKAIAEGLGTVHTLMLTRITEPASGSKFLGDIREYL